MSRNRTILLALLIPLLLDLLVFFSALPTSDDPQARIEQRTEEVQPGFRELEERSEEEDEISFGDLLADSMLSIRIIDFQRLEMAEQQAAFQFARALGWSMPLRI